MVIYSVTIFIDKERSADWRQWMSETHIPQVMATGYFTKFSLRRICEPQYPGRDAFSIEYTCETLQQCIDYQERAAPALRKV